MFLLYLFCFITAHQLMKPGFWTHRVSTVDFADCTLWCPSSCSLFLCISWKFTAGSRHGIRFNPFGKIIGSICSDYQRHVLSDVSLCELSSLWDLCCCFFQSYRGTAESVVTKAPWNSCFPVSLLPGNVGFLTPEVWEGTCANGWVLVPPVEVSEATELVKGA